MPENFDPQESALIGRYFTNLDKDISVQIKLFEGFFWMSLLIRQKWNLTKLLDLQIKINRILYWQ